MARVMRRKKRRIGQRELYAIWGIVMITLVFALYSALRNQGVAYLKIALVMTVMWGLTSFVVIGLEGNIKLLLYLILLLNFGFLTQLFTDKVTNTIIDSDLKNLIFAFVAAFIIAILYWKLSSLMSWDSIMYIMILIQFAIVIALILFGQSPDSSINGAKIVLQISGHRVQPLEVVKVLYVFTVVTLLCKEKISSAYILKMPRELFFFCYTILLAMGFAVIGEYGTLLVMLATAGCIYIVYTSNRKLLKWLYCIVGIMVALFGSYCIFTKNKIFNRFYYAWQPEKDASNLGYQGVRLLRALTEGGTFGPSSVKKLTEIPVDESDFVFAKLIQTCGWFMGLFLIIGLILFILECFKIMNQAQTQYQKGLVLGIMLQIGIQSLIHIGCNIGLLPICGIPLLFVSNGYVSLTMGFCLVAILLVLSMEMPEQREEKVR